MKIDRSLPPEIASLLQELLESPEVAACLAASTANLDWGSLGITGAKSSGMLETRGEARGGTGDRAIGEPSPAVISHAYPAAPEPKLEARYAYYRRCQHVRKNGRQCKGPAMKGEPICHNHAAQIDAAKRLEQERREFLARPGVSLGDPKSIQHALTELVSALLAGDISRKNCGRLLIEAQTAIQLDKKLSTQRKPSAFPRKLGLP